MYVGRFENEFFRTPVPTTVLNSSYARRYIFKFLLFKKQIRSRNRRINYGVLDKTHRIQRCFRDISLIYKSILVRYDMTLRQCVI